MNNKGMTLIELAVVLAIIAVLSAILTPVVSSYIDQARTARAQAEVNTIADAIKLYYRDTNRYPIYATSAQYTSDTPSNASDFAGSAVIGSAGVTPTESGVSWSLNTALANTTLDLFLNSNYSGAPTGQGLGQVSYRGPYIGTLDRDPFGNKYLLTAGNLERGSTKCAFVISAGQNGLLETSKDQTCTSTSSALTVTGDDVAARLQ